MNKLLPVLFFLISCSASRQIDSAIEPQSPFLVTPYLQLGSNPSPDSMIVLWHALASTDTDTSWTLNYKSIHDTIWIQAASPTKTTLAIKGEEIFNVYRATLTNLEPGSTFSYTVAKNGLLVFAAEGKAIKSASQPYRFVVSGDMGAGSKAAKQIATGIYKSNPDFVAIAGDIVYDNGLISEYKTRFWPMYNSEKVSMYGLPLMQSIPFFAALGNHDTYTHNLNLQPGALAYFHFWDQPLNGPEGIEGGPIVSELIANPKNREAFLEGAGHRYPRMSNYSFNYGNAHWTVLDANIYVDWTDDELRDWLRKDLAAAQNATWRFVLYHHPAISSSHTHYEDQQMRVVSNLFDSGNVDIVFNGHVHNYQRSFPMIVNTDASKIKKGRVPNVSWTLDKEFNGTTDTSPDGVIYIVTGAGGQVLYDPEQQNDPSSWQKFTDKFISLIHSFSLLDINGNNLKFSQIGTDGSILDSFEINKETN
ncbi:MAG: metallophosphoesterase family protein [Saprospiraceae bacterium]